MTNPTAQTTDGRYVRANGIDIHYVEAGAGEPLVLIHGGIVSTNPIWAGVPFAYVHHMDALAERFRVIAPDTRGSGRTINPGGPVSYDELAADAVALMEALELDRPMICGFSDGGMIASVVSIRSPDAVRAVVNHAGYDLLNPHAPTHAMMRMTLGGSPDAAQADPVAAERFFAQSPQMQAVHGLMKADHDGAPGPGDWTTHIAGVFDRLTRPAGHTFDDLGAVQAPTLVLTGDRDDFCTVEEGVTAYRALPAGELAILANHGHLVTPAAIGVTIEFLGRHAAL
jgi:pimeloyl-ACP methyl ester carboxylesterase